MGAASGRRENWVAWVDLGASWIHGIRGNPITKIAHTYGIETQATDYNTAVLFGPEWEPIPEQHIVGWDQAVTQVIASEQGGGLGK